MDERIELLIMSYLTGALNDQEKVEWERLIDEGQIDLKEVEAYRKMLQTMESYETPEPSEEMSARFYSGLEKEIVRSKRITVLDRIGQFFQETGISRTSLQVAYTLLLIVTGLSTGFLLIGKTDKSEIAELSEEVHEMKSMMMLSMLEQESPMERIRAVSLTQEMVDVDEEVVQALFRTLNNDSNTNVRLEALEALVRYSDDAKVRIGLIQSLREQQNPLVQLALADVMVLLQDPDARKVMEELLEKEDILDDVKKVISERLKSINS